MIGLLMLAEEVPKTVHTLLYVASSGLLAGVIYLFVNNKKEIKDKDKEHALALEKQRDAFMLKIKEKDDAITKITEDHRNDIKESNKDYKYLVDKFSEYMSQIEKVINARK